MSRLDIFTIVVVVICVAAIIFLLYRTTDLFKSKDALDNTQLTEESLYEDDGTTGDDFSDDPYYDDDTTEFDFLADTTSDSVTSPTESQPGTPKVAEEPVRESQPILNVEEMDDGGGSYLVLAGAFAVMSNAEAHAIRVQNLGFSSARVAIFNKGKYATVLVNRFENKSDASSVVNSLTDKGIESYVHMKRATKGN